ncbi:MAG: polysaccharide biosynthesis protein, partial [Candidatus Binatia bacterium]
GHRSVLRKAMLLTLLLAGGVVMIYWLFPDFIVNFLFGGKYLFTIPYLFKYGLAMFFYALSFLSLNFFLSRNQTKVAYAFLIAMLIEIGLIISFHDSIAQIVDIMLISGALCLTFMLPFYLRVRR